MNGRTGEVTESLELKPAASAWVLHKRKGKSFRENRNPFVQLVGDLNHMFDGRDFGVTGSLGMVGAWMDFQGFRAEDHPFHEEVFGDFGDIDIAYSGIAFLEMRVVPHAI